MKKTKRKRIEYKQVHLSSDFINMFDIKRKLEMPELDRISFSELEAERLRENLDLRKRKRRNVFDEFNP